MAREEELVEAPPEEEITAMEETPPTPVGAVMTHTVDEVPELSGKAIGDTITFRVSNISEDGNSYDLTVEETPPVEVGVGETVGAGREAVRSALVT